MATYIKAEVDGSTSYYQLDATTDVRYTTSGKLTSNPVQNGKKDVSDHYNQAQDTVTFSGILTKYKAKGKETEFVTDPKVYLSGLIELKNNATPVDIVIFQKADTLGNDIYDPLGVRTGYILESIEVSKQSGNGSRDLRLNISATQVTFADQTAVRSEVRAAPDMEDNVSELTQGPNSSQGLNDKKLIETVKDLASSGVSDVTGGF